MRILVLSLTVILFSSVTYAILAPTNGSEMLPRSAYDPVNDRYLVVFEMYTATGADIYGLFMDSEGLADGADFAISDNPDSQRLPDITYNSDSQSFLVVWQDRRDVDNNIYGQFIDANTGNLIDHASDTNFAITNETSNQQSPSVASNAGANRILVAWDDSRGGGNANIYGQFINSVDGSFLFNTISENFPITSDSGWHYDSDIAYDSTGDRFLVVWDESRLANTDIYGQFINSVDGSLVFNTVSQNFPVTNDINQQIHPSVAYDATGNRFLVVWRDWRGSTRDIYGQFINATDGTHLINTVSQNLMISNEPSADQKYPAVASTGLGAYLVVWEDERDASQNQIFGTAIDASDGALISNSSSENHFIMNSTESMFMPALSYSSSNDRFLVSAYWFDEGTDYGVESIVYPEIDVTPAGGGGSSGGGGGGCFIATAAYGSYSDSHVMALREFRDDVLFKSEFGTALVDMYYAYSPPVADFIAQHPALRLATRTALAPVVYTVKYPVLMGFVFAGMGLIGIRRRRK
jgi:hypothetical protein